jgi:hypothetical protein
MIICIQRKGCHEKYTKIESLKKEQNILSEQLGIHLKLFQKLEIE